VENMGSFLERVKNGPGPDDWRLTTTLNSTEYHQNKRDLDLTKKRGETKWLRKKWRKYKKDWTKK
jgi:hypothetical protein